MISNFYTYYGLTKNKSILLENNKMNLPHSLIGPAYFSKDFISWNVMGKQYCGLTIKYPYKNSKEFREFIFSSNVIIINYAKKLNISTISSAIDYCENQFQRILKLQTLS